jgi:hypothetical protein
MLVPKEENPDMTDFSHLEGLPKAYFSEANSAEVVTGQNINAQDARLREVMDIITKHLHAAVKEIEPTQEEWFQAIQFLTATGHTCDDWRQEFILLSDVLGVSMLVDAINSRRPDGASENTVLGPFHVADAPEYPMGANICLDAKARTWWSAVGFLMSKAARLQASRSTFGRPMMKASMTSSKKAISQSSICAACSVRAKMAAIGSRRSNPNSIPFRQTDP